MYYRGRIYEQPFLLAIATVQRTETRVNAPASAPSGASR
ncbi:hypothetical protein FMEAI12_3240026 [Parafrankia sp. Ea1.12]|nr:hypothetical protein FMEAI12_3240026 [Parafrankia sp. Ea1.12]